MATGLLVYVLRHPREAGDVFDIDTTNGGISSRFTCFVLTGEGVSGPFRPDANTPELKLVRRKIGGREYLHVEPVEGKDPRAAGWMAGGNFVYTSDSRFPNAYPLSIHDRQEFQG